jgi:hypothetical protein
MKLDLKAFGMVCGIFDAVFTLLIALMHKVGFGLEVVEMVLPWYIFDLSSWLWMWLGVVEGFIFAFVCGWAFAWVYNKFV